MSWPLPVPPTLSTTRITKGFIHTTGIGQKNHKVINIRSAWLQRTLLHKVGVYHPQAIRFSHLDRPEGVARDVEKLWKARVQGTGPGHLRWHDSGNGPRDHRYYCRPQGQRISSWRSGCLWGEEAFQRNLQIPQYSEVSNKRTAEIRVPRLKPSFQMD